MEYPKMIYKGGIASTGVVVQSAEEEAAYVGYSSDLLTYDVEPEAVEAEEAAPARRGRKPKAE